MKKYPIVISLFLYIHASAQTDTNRYVIPDTTLHLLKEVSVKAYETGKGLLQTPAPVALINETQLNQDDNTGILSAVNATPGVRMEERSPGSYRFGIRGSSLESPFGVRNVKIYYDGIPFTGPSGNTYLNQLGFYNIRSLEIIKGPASSIYGAGTGGAILINSIPQHWQSGAAVRFTGGSYNLNNSEAELRIGDSLHKNIISYQHFSCDGYRQQSAMKNDIVTWDADIKHKASELDAHFLYGDLTYQTPGGLTLAEYDSNAKQARPATGSIPGAVQSNATVYQQMFLAGFSYKLQLNSFWQNTTTLYGDYTQMLNPNIRNYSRSVLPDYGGRTVFKYENTFGQNTLQWITGGEVAGEIADNTTYAENAGQPGSLQANQELNSTSGFAFTQLTWQVKQWIFTGGISFNELQIRLQNFSPYSEQTKNFNNQLAPRIAMLNRITNNISVYATAEKGFSPPSIDELAPTGSAVNFALDAEHGYNYEIGIRGATLQQKLFADISVFYFTLQDAIVQRRDSAGGDYYLNAGSTEQAGIEAAVNYRVLENKNSFVGPLYIGIAYTGDHFRYKDFEQLGVDYSGNQLPGVAPNTLAASVQFYIRAGFYVYINYLFSDRIPLDDANDAYAASYHILNARLGYKKTFRHIALEVFSGATNLLNQKYSLGDDINGAGGRFYNVAAPVSFYAGLELNYFSKI